MHGFLRLNRRGTDEANRINWAQERLAPFQNSIPYIITFLDTYVWAGALMFLFNNLAHHISRSTDHDGGPDVAASCRDSSCHCHHGSTKPHKIALFRRRTHKVRRVLSWWLFFSSCGCASFPWVVATSRSLYRECSPDVQTKVSCRQAKFLRNAISFRDENSCNYHLSTDWSLISFMRERAIFSTCSEKVG